MTCINRSELTINFTIKQLSTLASTLWMQTVVSEYPAHPIRASVVFMDQDWSTGCCPHSREISSVTLKGPGLVNWKCGCMDLKVCKLAKVTRHWSAKEVKLSGRKARLQKYRLLIYCRKELLSRSRPKISKAFEELAMTPSRLCLIKTIKWLKTACLFGSGGFKVDMHRDTSKDRTIVVRYNPTEPGDYKIEVGAAGKYSGWQKVLIIELSYYGVSTSYIQKVQRNWQDYDFVVDECFMPIIFP